MSTRGVLRDRGDEPRVNRSEPNWAGEIMFDVIQRVPGFCGTPKNCASSKRIELKINGRKIVGRCRNQ